MKVILLAIFRKTTSLKATVDLWGVMMKQAAETMKKTRELVALSETKNFEKKTKMELNFGGD